MHNVYSLINEFEIKKIPYLCLKMDESLLIHLLNLLKEKKLLIKLGIIIHIIPLQIALWNIDYLLSNIEQSKSIWHFERQQLSKEHYHVRNNLFHYTHIVEKGEWNYGTKRYVEKFLCKFEPGQRKFRGSFLGKYFSISEKYLFNLWLFNIENQKKLISFYRFFNINKCLSIYIIKKIRSIANHNTFFSTTLTLSILLPFGILNTSTFHY